MTADDDDYYDENDYDDDDDDNNDDNDDDDDDNCCLYGMQGLYRQSNHPNLSESDCANVVNLGRGSEQLWTLVTTGQLSCPLDESQDEECYGCGSDSGWEKGRGRSQ